MIIWGSRGLTSTVSEGQFNCPKCSAKKTYRMRQVRNFFTLYFIPVIPLNVAGRYAECTSCSGTFAEEILSYDPEAEKAKTHEQLLRVMVMAALADGNVSEEERQAIKKQYMDLAGLPLVEDTLQREIQLASQSGANLNDYVGRMAADLSDHGKALVVRLAFHTMSAAGDLQPGHQEQLSKLAKTLRIPDQQYRALIEHLSQE